MAAVVDTDVFSFDFKDDTRKVLFEPHLTNQFLFLSFMSFAELHSWSLNRGWGPERIARLERAFGHYSIQYSTREICLLWSEIMYESRLNGKPVGISDGWVAATAISLGVPLISHNANHFRHIRRLELITENK